MKRKFNNLEKILIYILNKDFNITAKNLSKIFNCNIRGIYRYIEQSKEIIKEEFISKNEINTIKSNIRVIGNNIILPDYETIDFKFDDKNFNKYVLDIDGKILIYLLNKKYGFTQHYISEIFNCTDRKVQSCVRLVDGLLSLKEILIDDIYKINTKISINNSKVITLNL